MLKKILWFVLIILVLYIILVFVSPTTADKIGNALGIIHFNEVIRNTKTKVDEIYTNLPSQDEVKDALNKAKEDFSSGANMVKDKVDDLRENLNDTAEQYEDLKNQFNETKDQIETGIDTIKSFSGVLNNSGTTNSGTTNSGTTNNP